MVSALGSGLCVRPKPGSAPQSYLESSGGKRALCWKELHNLSLKSGDLARRHKQSNLTSPLYTSYCLHISEERLQYRPSWTSIFEKGSDLGALAGVGQSFLKVPGSAVVAS